MPSEARPLHCRRGKRGLEELYAKRKQMKESAGSWPAAAPKSKQGMIGAPPLVRTQPEYGKGTLGAGVDLSVSDRQNRELDGRASSPGSYG